MSRNLPLFFLTAVLLTVGALAGPPAGAKVDTKSLGSVFATDTRKFETYAGYLPINKNTEFYYVFVTQQDVPYGEGPLLLWLNGGPGCSSLDGLFYEQGPWVFPGDDTELTINDHAWNKYTNVLYLESPSSVGFSTGPSDFVHTDLTTAQQNLKAIVEFLKAYPEYKKSELHLSGESYAGIYVPSLAGQIHEYNQKNTQDQINLKGFAVGNGVVSIPLADQVRTAYTFAYRHNLLAPSSLVTFNSLCKGKNAESDDCQNFVNDQTGDIFNYLNPYNIYEVCYDDSKYSLKEAQRDSARFLRLEGANKLFFNPYSELPPCAGVHGLTELANSKKFQEVFHVKNFSDVWSICARDEIFQHDMQTDSFLPEMAKTYGDLIQLGYKVIYFSGDADTVCSIETAIVFFEKLFKDFTLITSKTKSQWHIPGQGVDPEPQTVGFVQTRGTFSFIQVLGVGHMVPQWGRVAAAKTIKSFIEDVNLD